jgi:hypothetical protein
MDTSLVISWWTCSDCGAAAELNGRETAGCHVACPDCEGAMVEMWTWEASAGPLRQAA